MCIGWGGSFAQEARCLDVETREVTRTRPVVSLLCLVTYPPALGASVAVIKMGRDQSKPALKEHRKNGTALWYPTSSGNRW